MALQRKAASSTAKEVHGHAKDRYGMEEPRKDSKGIDCNGNAEQSVASRSNGRAMS